MKAAHLTMASASAKRASSFSFEDICFVCGRDKKDPKTNFRANVKVASVGDIEPLRSPYE